MRAGVTPETQRRISIGAKVSAVFTIFTYHGGMEQTARIEQWFCRRQAPRFRLGMPARLITLERHLTVVIEDLSESGARVTLPVPHVFGVCVLRWMDYHAFAEVRWTRELAVGLQFANPISPEMLAETSRCAPDLVSQLKRHQATRSC